MRFLSLASLGLVSLVQLVASQDLSTLPACAVTCALNAIGATGCSATDAHCVCSATSFLTTVQTCIGTACNATDVAATLAFAQQYCLSGGVTITLPTGGAVPATTVSPSSAPGSTVSASAAPPTVSATSTITSLSPASSGGSSAPPPAATFTGAANVLQQQWGVLGLLGLGVAAVI
ncbi:hypothetical protein LTR84_003307 [Exophiala bonariae]|uniref:CFEM domain-containing protein n=1 Tax=Exophiala bonariae TaxID=1690606 RepID=A0AAV9N6X9_9EURO|nr:hypothetical protein LTR84_003307 [Exophiala bonariae]